LLGFCLRPSCKAYNALSDSLAVFKGAYFQGNGNRKEKREEWMDKKVRKGEEGRKWERKRKGK